MCARLRESGPDAVVTWNSSAEAQAFLDSKGADVAGGFSVVAIGDDSLKDMAAALGIREEDIELVPFPS